MARKADKHPKDFKITKESGITIREESFFGDVPAESRMTGCVMENADYGNAKRLTLKFERHTSEAMLEPLKDYIEFYRMQAAEEIIRHLRELADRLELTCVEALKHPK